MVKKGLRSCHVNGGGSADRSHGNINHENYAKSGCAAKTSEIKACSFRVEGCVDPWTSQEEVRLTPMAKYKVKAIDEK